MSCGVGRRWGSDSLLLWLWLVAATAPIRPLAWEPPYAAWAALDRKGKKTKNKLNKNKNIQCWSSCFGLAVTNPTSIHEDAGLIPFLAQWVKGSAVAVNYGVGQQLQLWFNPQAWEPPYATGAALESKLVTVISSDIKYIQNIVQPLSFIWFQNFFIAPSGNPVPT